MIPFGIQQNLAKIHRPKPEIFAQFLKSYHCDVHSKHTVYGECLEMDSNVAKMLLRSEFYLDEIFGPILQLIVLKGTTAPT